MSELPPKNKDSRLRSVWPARQRLEPESEVLQPGDKGYEEADDDDRPLIPDR